MSGLVAGVVGGILVAWLSGSHTSVSGPAAGLTAIVAAQVQLLGFEAFLLAVFLAGALQLGLGILRAGSLAAFFPASVIKGLLSAIGIILILKQIPHLFGHDPNWLGDMSFFQLDNENTFSGLIQVLFHIHPGATVIGLSSLALLIFWDRSPLKKAVIPAPLIVVFAGVGMVFGLEKLGEGWGVSEANLVQVPITSSIRNFIGSLHSPDLSAITDPRLFVAAITVAIVASLETLLNLEAVDKLDPQKRGSPPNRELIAQGVGNMTCGMLGGLPITSVVVRSSVGISSGSKTRMACFIHGVLLLVLVLLLPALLNLIPLSCLAAILMVTGFKLATPKLFREMWDEGRNQFLPFIVTVIAIIFTDLLVGILIGLAVAALFILHGNLKSPLRKIWERHAGGEVLRIEFASQMTFLNRAALRDTLNAIPHQSQVVLDAGNTVYMDSDIIDLIREFEKEIAPAHQINLSLMGFQEVYQLDDRITYVDVSTKEIQERATPLQVLHLLKEGNERFYSGQPVTRDPRRQVALTSMGQFPQAIVLACIDSRVNTEMIFDLGLGDIYSLRVAGNIVSEEELGSMEYACAVTGAKLILILGHTGCAAVISTINLIANETLGIQTSAFPNLSAITEPIAETVLAETETATERHGQNENFVNQVTALHVCRMIGEVKHRSAILQKLIDDGKILLVGGLYDITTGKVLFFDSPQDLDQHS